VMRMIYRLSTHVTVNSSSVRDLLFQRGGLPPEKIRVLHNAVDVGRVATAPRDRDRLFRAREPIQTGLRVVANMYSRVKGHTS